MSPSGGVSRSRYSYHSTRYEDRLPALDQREAGQIGAKQRGGSSGDVGVPSGSPSPPTGHTSGFAADGSGQHKQLTKPWRSHCRASNGSSVPSLRLRRGWPEVRHRAAAVARAQNAGSAVGVVSLAPVPGERLHGITPGLSEWNRRAKVQETEVHSSYRGGTSQMAPAWHRCKLQVRS